MKRITFQTAFLFITCVCLETNAQHLSPLRAKFSTQASGPSVVISVTAKPPRNISVLWGFQWKYNQMPIALVSIEPDMSPYITVIGNEDVRRLNVSVSPGIVENEYFFTSELTIDSLRPEDDNLTISIFSNQVPKEYHSSLSLRITNCSASAESLIAVETDSAQAAEPGYFSCVNGGILHFFNGTLLAPNETTCQAVGGFLDEDTAQCWKAPQVTLNGPLSLTEGSLLKVTCDYQDVVPSGNTSLFYVDDQAFTVEKEQPFVLVVNSSLNNAEISCQAVTPFTEIVIGSGISSVFKLNVEYPPFMQSSSTFTWMFNKTEECHVIFKSNPSSGFVSLEKDGQVLTNSSTALFFMEDVHNDEKLEDKASRQRFYFRRLRVSEEDAGLYTLTVQSSVSPYKHSMSFRINIVGVVQMDTTDNPTGLIAGVTVAGVVVLILLLAMLIYCCSRTGKSNGDDIPGSAAGDKKEQEGFIAMKPIESKTEINTA